MATTEFMRAQQDALAAYGVQARSRSVPVPVLDGQAQVLVAGAGPPLLLVIGAGVPAALWAPLMAHLTDYRRYAVDLPGQGGTDRATEVSTAGLRRMMTTFLREVMTGLGLDTAAIVAQSFGATSASWLALDHPERVDSLTLVGCPAALLGTSAPLPVRLMSVPPLARVLTAVAPPSPRQVDRFGRLAGESFRRHPTLRELMVRFERLPHFAGDFSRLLHALLTPRGARAEIQITEDQLARLRRPVQFVWGARDPFGPPSVGHRAAAIVPGARCHEVPGGHAPWLDEAAPIAALVSDFLATHRQGHDR